MTVEFGNAHPLDEAVCIVSLAPGGSELRRGCRRGHNHPDERVMSAHYVSSAVLSVLHVLGYLIHVTTPQD